MGTFLLAAAGALVAGAITPGDPAQVSTGDPAQVSNEDGLGQADGAETTIRGAAANDSAGTSVARVGDVNGDNVTDLAVGAPGNDTGGEDAGAVYLFYGPVEPGTELADADAMLVGESAGDEVGQAVAGAGDLNGDSADELLVGAPLRGEADAGAAYVVAGGDSLDGTVDLGEAGVVLEGTAGDRAGWSVADGADAAGAPSVIVGAPRYDPGESEDARDAGAAYLVTNATLDQARASAREGAEGRATLSLARDADATLVGEGDRDLAGWAVDTGDVNDDGSSDVVVGARKHNQTSSASAEGGASTEDGATAEGGANAGAAYVVHGPVAGTTDLSTADLQLRGEDGGDQAGYAVASGTDVDGDGVDDVVVGAPFTSPSEDRQNAGSAYVISGGANQSGEQSLAAADATLAGEGVGHRAGWAVATGNGTCDAVGDVLVGAPRLDAGGEHAGGAYLVTGGDSLDGSANLTAEDRTLVGASAGDEAGRAVALPGDLSGDDAPEIAVGAPFVDAGADSPGVGAAVLRYGECPDEQPATKTPDATPDDEAPAVPEPVTETATGTQTDTETSTAKEDTATATDTATPDETETATETETQNEIDTPTETDTSTGTDRPDEDETPADGQASSLEVEISCERGQAYVFNPNGGMVTITIDGPDGPTTDEVGPGQDLGGPAAPSLNGDSLPPGEYTVTAEDENGNAVPVNGESSWTTSVKDCPTTTVETQCVDGDTFEVSVTAENLDGRHANPVDVQVQSPRGENRERSEQVTPRDGVAQTDFTLSDDAQSTVTIDLANYQPSLLATLTVQAGGCDDLAQDGDGPSGDAPDNDVGAGNESADGEPDAENGEDAGDDSLDDGGEEAGTGDTDGDEQAGDDQAAGAQSGNDQAENEQSGDGGAAGGAETGEIEAEDGTDGAGEAEGGTDGAGTAGETRDSGDEPGEADESAVSGGQSNDSGDEAGS